jgi:hypothetical protein
MVIARGVVRKVSHIRKLEILSPASSAKKGKVVVYGNEKRNENDNRSKENDTTDNMRTTSARTQKASTQYMWLYNTYVLVLQCSEKRQCPQIDLQMAWFAILRAQSICTQPRQIW